MRKSSSESYKSMTENNPKKAPLVILAGPTASGKSDLSVLLAKKIGGSIISADSMQVYRGMDIGSAKITKEEMQGIPHYLIDIISPLDEWNVVRFKEEARKAADEILAGGRIPILCGGTGFYIQALLYDIDFEDTKTDTGLREELMRKAAAEGPASVYEILREKDPISAAAIHPNNVKRVIRAIEFASQKGSSIAEHNKSQREREPAFNSAYYVLTRKRDVLYERIDERVDRMMEKGLLEEVIRLKDELSPPCKGDLRRLVSMQGLGYRQLLAYLDGECSLDEAVCQIKLQTRHFAKRQLTWFKRERDTVFVPQESFLNPEEEAGYLIKDLTERQLLNE